MTFVVKAASSAPAKALTEAAARRLLDAAIGSPLARSFTLAVCVRSVVASQGLRANV